MSRTDDRIYLYVFIESVSEKQCISLLQMDDGNDLTVLQVEIYWDKEDTMMTIRDTVTKDVWLEVLTTQLPIYPDRRRQERVNNKPVQLFNKYRNAAMIKKAPHK